MINNKSLLELVTAEAKQEDYDKFVDLLVEHVKERYKNFEFQIMSPEVHSYANNYTLSFTLSRHGDRELYNKLFRHTMAKGLKEDEINKLIKERAKAGDIIELGEGIEIDEGFTGGTSILDGQDMTIFIAFTTKEIRDKKEAKLKEEEQ